MNGLSWSIYIIYLIGNIHLLLLILGIVFVGSQLAVFVYHADKLSWESNRKDWPEHTAKRNSAFKKILIILPAFITLSFVVPDKQTAVLIAASQVGEKIVSSEKVTSVVDPSVDLLKTWIQNELNEQRAKLGQTIKNVTKEKATEVGKEAAKKALDAAKKALDE